MSLHSLGHRQPEERDGFAQALREQLEDGEPHHADLRIRLVEHRVVA